LPTIVFLPVPVRAVKPLNSLLFLEKETQKEKNRKHIPHPTLRPSRLRTSSSSKQHPHYAPPSPFPTWQWAGDTACGGASSAGWSEVIGSLASLRASFGHTIRMDAGFFEDLEPR
jgi:hypothetical protein